MHTTDPTRDAFGDRGADSPPPLPAEPSGCARVAKGCGCAAAVMLLVLVALGTWVAFSWRTWAVSLTRQVAEAALDSAPLEADDRRRILAAIDRLGAEFKAGRVSIEQMGHVFEEIAEGPVMPLAFLVAIDAKYLQSSGLPDEEKAAARRTLERAARGVATRAIDPAEAIGLLDPLFEREPGDADSYRLRERLTDAEIREFVDRVRERVEAAGVPDEPFDVDVAAEVEAAVARALGDAAEADGR